MAIPTIRKWSNKTTPTSHKDLEFMQNKVTVFDVFLSWGFVRFGDRENGGKKINKLPKSFSLSHHCPYWIPKKTSMFHWLYSDKETTKCVQF